MPRMLKLQFKRLGEDVTYYTDQHVETLPDAHGALVDELKVLVRSTNGQDLYD
jgi:hypothetical protein